MDEHKLPTEFKVDLPNLEVAISADDIFRCLTPTQVLKLIIELDDAVGDWTMTTLLYHHFSREFGYAQKSVPDLTVKTEEQLLEDLAAEGPNGQVVA